MIVGGDNFYNGDSDAMEAFFKILCRKSSEAKSDFKNLIWNIFDFAKAVELRQNVTNISSGECLR